MTDAYESIGNSLERLKVPYTTEDMAALAIKENMNESQIKAVRDVLQAISEAKDANIATAMLRCSGLPWRNPKTFGNFDFNRIAEGDDKRKLEALKTCSVLESRQNIALIGPQGIGKTHLAMALGYECCKRGVMTRFLKMTELKDKFDKAMDRGTEQSMITSLMRPPCLIIDEVGHCEFGKDETRMFFDMIDKRYSKQDPATTVFTSNRTPSQWKELFEDSDSLLCALDRIFDQAIIFNLDGESYRGQKRELVNISVIYPN
jgi:DNA replication protein DnaC